MSDLYVPAETFVALATADIRKILWDDGVKPETGYSIMEALASRMLELQVAGEDPSSLDLLEIGFRLVGY